MILTDTPNTVETEHQRLKFTDGFTAVATSDRAPRTEIDVFGDEPHGTVAQQDMYAADMQAAGRHIGPR